MKEIETRERQITSLVEKYYKKFDFLHQEPLAFLTSKALNLYLHSELSIDEVENQLIKVVREKEKELDSSFNKENVIKNHQMVNSQLKRIIPLLNDEGIDYYLGGALAGYICYKEEAERCHDDIDFLINENDLGKIEKICKELNYSFYDHRLESSRVLKNGIPVGEHEVIATMKNNSFHLGFLCFERLIDGTIIFKGYYHDEENNPYCREEIVSDSLAKEILPEESVRFHGYPVPIMAPEYIYLLKRHANSEKDQSDLAFFEKKMDFNKLAKIQSLVKTERCIEFSPAGKMDSIVAKENTMELSELLEKTAKYEIIKDDKKDDIIPRQKIRLKTKKAGFTNRYMLMGILLLVVFAVIVFFVLKWIKII